MFVIFDLDGTLADITHRLHYIKNKPRDWISFFKACSLDEPKWPIIKTARALYSVPEVHLEIWSGRSDIVRKETENWLYDHRIPFQDLIMRPHGHNVSDVELKQAWLNNFINGTNGRRPDLVFDDRQCIVDMWRANGITCCQVEQWSE